MTENPAGRTLRRVQRALAGVLLAALLVGTTLTFAKQQQDTLLVWAGDQERTDPDFIAVVDFDPGSRTYGKVLRTVPLSGASAIGNEPHHVSLSHDGPHAGPWRLAQHPGRAGRSLLLRRHESAPADVHPFRRSA